MIFSEPHRVTIVFHQVSFLYETYRVDFWTGVVPHDQAGIRPKELYKNFLSTQPSFSQRTMSISGRFFPEGLVQTHFDSVWKKKKLPLGSFESGASTEDSGQEMQVHLHRQIQQGGQSRIPAGLLCNLNTVFLLLTLQLSPETDQVVSAVITVLSCDKNILLLNL